MARRSRQSSGRTIKGRGKNGYTGTSRHQKATGSGLCLHQKLWFVPKSKPVHLGDGQEDNCQPDLYPKATNLTRACEYEETT